MKFELAIFDMDGTILNTLEDLKDSLNIILKKYGFKERTLEEVRCFVGNGIAKLIERAVTEECSEEQRLRMYQDFMAYYKDHCAEKTKPYEGIVSLLSDLRKSGMKLAVVSNKADIAVQELCIQYFEGLFDMAAGEKAGVAKKPAPDMVEGVLDRLGILKERAVYIGDSEVDVETARNAGLHLCAVQWGFRDADVLKKQGADRIFEDTESLKKYLLGEE